MELHAVVIVVMYRSREISSILRHSDRVSDHRGAEGMNEIEKLIVPNAGEQGAPCRESNAVPAHMGNFHFSFLEFFNSARDDAKALCVTLIRVFKEDLHANAYAEKGNLDGS